MSVFSCNCGRVKKNVPLLNNVLKELICPVCSGGLKDTSRKLSTQVKIDHYYDECNKESFEAIRIKVYNYFMTVDDATDSEVQKALGYQERNNVSPRRFELVQMGLLKKSTKRFCTAKPSNKRVIAWKLSK